MCCKSWKSILPFVLTFLVGIFVVNIFSDKHQNILKNSVIYSKCFKASLDETRKEKNREDVTAGCWFGPQEKEKPYYKLNLKESHRIKAQQRYIDKIFEPQKVNGKPVSVTKQIDYSFTIY